MAEASPGSPLPLSRVIEAMAGHLYLKSESALVQLAAMISRPDKVRLGGRPPGLVNVHRRAGPATGLSLRSPWEGRDLFP